MHQILTAYPISENGRVVAQFGEAPDYVVVNLRPRLLTTDDEIFVTQVGPVDSRATGERVIRWKRNVDTFVPKLLDVQIANRRVSSDKRDIKTSIPHFR